MITCLLSLHAGGAYALLIFIDLKPVETQQHYFQVDFLLPRQKNSDNLWIFNATWITQIGIYLFRIYTSGLHISFPVGNYPDNCAAVQTSPQRS